MKVSRLIIIVVILLFGIYAVSMSFVEKSKSFTISKDVNFPMEKVYPQLINLQNFSGWNDFNIPENQIAFTYYTPYEGEGSSLHFVNKKDSTQSGDVYIRYVNPNKAIRYFLFRKNDKIPFVMDVKFKPVNRSKTNITWFIKTPEEPYFRRSLNLFTENYFSERIEKSIRRLGNVLGNKVDKEAQLSSIKYDSIMTEHKQGGLLLGLNISSNNKKGDLYQSVILNYNKLYAFVTHDLSKKDDEFGIPQMIFDPQNLKSKELSYYYGVEFNKRFGVSDNNFTFRTVGDEKQLVMYYKGSFDGINRVVSRLLSEANKQNLSTGEVTISFLNPPTEGGENVLKVALKAE